MADLVMEHPITFAAWLPPVAYGLIPSVSIVVIGSLAIGFTSPSSRLRYVAFVAQLLVLYCMDASWGARIHWSFAASLLATHAFSTVLQYATVALLAQWSYEHKGPVSPEPYLQRTQRSRASSPAKPRGPQRGLVAAALDRLAFGYNAMQAFRMLNTPYEARNTPPFSKLNPAYVPSKLTFLLTTFANFAACYLLMDALNSRDPSPGESLMTLAHVPFFRRLSDVTAPELTTRAAVTVAAFFSGQLTLTWIYSALALASVSLGCSSPRDWRPLFGHATDAYSLRRFWNSTWHQLSRLELAAAGSLVAYRWLGCAPKSAVGRCVVVAVAFACSGVQHFLGDRAEGVAWTSSGSFNFFVTQMLGIALEDLVQRAWTEVGGSRGGVAMRMLGRVWVFCFMAWSLPAMIYNGIAARADFEPSPMVPWSIIGYMQGLRNSTDVKTEL